MADPGRIYCDPGFFDRATCDRLIRAMDAGAGEDAEVMDEGFELDVAVRRAKSVEVAASALDEVETALDTCRERLSAFFSIPLAAREGAGFLRYVEGGFYAPHVDRADVSSWPAAARRAVAVVVFLNGSRDASSDGTFDGGVLRVYEAGGPIDVVPRAGMLAAFRADALHEVTEVRGGVRDAIVDWFYAGEGGP